MDLAITIGNLVAALAAFAAFVKTYTSDRPFIVACLPFSKNDYPPHSDDPGYRWWCLRLHNAGNHPAIVTRLAIDTEAVFPGNPPYPEPMAPSFRHKVDARGPSHALGHGADSQWLHMGSQFVRWAVELDPSKDAARHKDVPEIFVRIIIEYQDNFGRLFRSTSQHRFMPKLQGFRLAWPGDVSDPRHNLASDYLNHETLRGIVPGLIHLLKLRFSSWTK